MAHSNKTCALALTEIASKYMDSDEVSNFILEHQHAVKRIQAEDRLISLDRAEAQAADELLTKLDKMVVERKRNSAYSLKKRLEVIDYILKNYEDSPIEGFNAFLAGAGGDAFAIFRGSKGFVEGSLDSVKKEMNRHVNAALGAFEEEMRSKDLWDIHNSGKLDKEVMIELFNLRDGVASGKSGSDIAVKIATVLESHQEYNRLRANDYGADIDKLKGYIINQSHDYYKIKPQRGETKEVAKQRWKDTIRPLLNMTLSFGEDGPTANKYLGEVYDSLLSGVQLDFESPISRFQGPGSMQKRISASRHLVFKDGESFFKYNNLYGTGTLNEAYTAGLRRLANNTALLKRLGVNPRDNLEQIFASLKTIYSRKDNANVIHSFREVANTGMAKSSANLIAEIMGDTRRPVNKQLATIGNVARGIESMAKLGQSLISSLSDPVSLVEEAAFQGRGRFAGMTDVVRGLSGKHTPEERRIASSMGVISEAMPGLLAERYGLDESLSGSMSKTLQIYFNINGQRWWTDTLREAHSLGLIHYMGSHIKDGTVFKELPAEKQHLLTAYNITEKEWQLYSKSNIETVNGRDYLTVDNLKTMDDSIFAEYLGITPETPNYEKKLRIGKEDVIGKLQNYITDRSNIAVMQPDAHEQALFRQGTQPGTYEGELLRAFGQFKSFGVSAINNSVNKLVFAKGGGANAFDAIAKGNSSLMGLANTFVMMTIMGYISMTIKDYLKGRNPRELNAKTITAAMIQGGSMGLYGDVLFGESSKYGQNFTSSLLGPEAGLIDDLIATARAGKDIGSVAVKRLDNHLPFTNLFYIKPFFDFMISYRLQEMVNPGYLNRMEQQISADSDQSFWLKPSDVVK